MIGLDLGRRRIGVAVSDDGPTVATPRCTIKRVGDRPVEHARIAEVADDIGAVLVVAGLPISLDGSDGPAARAVRSEVRALARALGIPVELVDERLTTVTATEALQAQDVSGGRRRDIVDQMAAAVILQTWLDRSSLER